MTDPFDALVAAATDARVRAFAPHSKFLVGAALEAEDGSIWTGCNVESASYGLTICAERVALVKGVSEGRHRFRRVVVVTAAAKLTPPCGACRQLLWEFAPEAEVLLANPTTDQRSLHKMADLLPHGFDSSSLTEPK